MKTAIGLFGIHYLDGLNHWMGWSNSVDYRQNLLNNMGYIWKDMNPTFYSSTYYSEILSELINDFNFKSLQLSKIDNKKETNVGLHWAKRNRKFKQTIKLILEDNIVYDRVILMRYDLYFKQNPFELNYKEDAINLICKGRLGDDDSICDDNFYIIPYSELQSFYDTVSGFDENMIAHYYNHHIKDFNYLIEGSYFSHELPVYSINRITINDKSV